VPIEIEEGCQMSGKIVRMALGVTVVLALAVAGSTPAMARPGDVIKTGSCSGSSSWKLKLSPEDVGIQVEFEVDSNVNGQAWNVLIKQNGAGIFSGSRVTGPPSGSFNVSLVAADAAGRDKFKAQAVNPATGEVCKGKAKI
jgi:hypothetical protein